MDIKLSVIIAVLDSHEVFRRQLVYWGSLDLPDNIEFIIMDDGSEVPLTAFPGHKVKNLRIVPTNDKRPWTVSLARNAGARLAQSENLLMTDIDHILTADGLKRGCQLEWPNTRMTFHRRFGILNEEGKLSLAKEDLIAYGLPPERIERKGLYCPAHGNSYVMKAKAYWDIGGYREHTVGKPYPQLDEHHFRGSYRKYEHQGKGRTQEYRPYLYHFPNGHYCHDGADNDFNPFGLFHNLSRKKLVREPRA